MNTIKAPGASMEYLPVRERRPCLVFMAEDPTPDALHLYHSHAETSQRLQSS